MTRPKKNSSQKRIIIDLGYPKGISVNARIVKGFYQGQQFNFSLPSVVMLADRLLIAGAGSWLWTADLSRAYRRQRVCPLSAPLLGIGLEDSIYVDIAPTFWVLEISTRMRTHNESNSLVAKTRRLLQHVLP